MLTSELYFEEYTYLDLLLGVRPLPYHLPMVVAQWEIGIGILGEIAVSLRRPHKESPTRREQVNTALQEGGWKKVFRFPSRAPRLPAAVVVCFGSVGGRYHGGIEVSKHDVARGKGGVWVMIEL